ncbi:hypothetical protein [Pseudomonas amygdali]|uniref:hypothetical protein n=1 Tax=Pseudomonas amygdali TaxID=47877 RepID=UPI000C32818D|nr:hypothetical protein [Pseudomonas amygdali]PWD02049.1 hypothetical protein CX658_19035 [Pseudomonas amygdali pv. lachrymans]
MTTDNKRSTAGGIATTASDIGTGGKLNKALRNTHFLVAAVVLGLAFQVWSKHEATMAFGFALCAASLLLTSLGALHLSDKYQKAVIVISLVVAAAGAFTFWKGIEQEALGGPRVNNLTFEFRAAGFDVQPVSNQPCTPQSQTNPLSYTCDVKVAPLGQRSAPTQQ